MKRSLKNILIILLIILLGIGEYFTIKCSLGKNKVIGNENPKIEKENRPELPNGEMDDGNRPELPNGEMDDGNRPELPNGEMDDGNRPELPNGQSETNSTKIQPIYYAIFIAENLVLSLLFVYLLMSNFNKKTFKETFSSKDKIVITILSLVILTSILSYLSICFSENNINDRQTNSNENKHGGTTTILEENLYTIEDVKEGDKDYAVNEDTQGKAKDGVYSKLFNKESIQDVKINIDENNWNYLLQNAIDKPTVLANSISIGNNTVLYVGIKTKGNLTLKEVWNSTSDRFSFTINFGKYINTDNGYTEKQNLYGLRKVALNNIYGDATLMKEYLSYELMTKMGVPTPEYSLINLYINDEFYGVYMMAESIDSSLTQRTLGEKSDYLVKPESSGGDLVYDNSLDKYINDNGEFDFSSIIYDEAKNIVYPSDKSNPLYKYNGLWENDEDTFYDIVDMLPTIFKWMKTLNELSNTDNPNTNEYKTKLEEIIDVDNLIRYFAVNTYLVNLDSYQSEKMQNYALYINESGKASILPWDYNYSFGVYGLGSASDVVNFDIYNPIINTTLKDRPLLNVILQNDEYKALYEKYLNDITIITSLGGTTSDGITYEKDNFKNILDKYNTILENIYGSDPTAFYTLDEYNKATESLEKLIELRTESVINQLSGSDEKISTDINLRTMGESVGGGNRR